MTKIGPLLKYCWVQINQGKIGGKNISHIGIVEIVVPSGT
jgi:hypothetical protein